ncbi:sialate O-acetylesterase [Pedobacter frigiditerrae]|uniref:Sialate O-acetylesterase n=1 Tax=Pedobacter frigiditerrae TaxID=2530452 RepID=A0A4R0N1D6_9SPHI|nr:sialate O-acetylesterase [Pedobacter frigiditerrae]TCC93608.1 sialate O-acetylesterase [Pedobacter frigiditerrae]
MKYLVFVALTLVCFSFRLKNWSEKPRKQIYLLMGQSNMAGRGVITDEYKELQHTRVLMLNANNEWVAAKHPIHFDKPKVAGVGPGLAFGAALADAFPKDSIYLVPCAVGGTSIAKWEPGAFDKSTNTHPYDDALLRIKEAMKLGKINGAIWLQGESDSNPKSAAVYLEKLTALIERVRKETNNPNLPFVVGELGQYRDNYKLINEVLHQVPQKIKLTNYVTSEGLTHKGDTTHFDSPSATTYGVRFAKEMLMLIKK